MSVSTKIADPRSESHGVDEWREACPGEPYEFLNRAGIENNGIKFRKSIGSFKWDWQKILFFYSPKQKFILQLALSIKYQKAFSMVSTIRVQTSICRMTVNEAKIVQKGSFTYLEMW